jgi:hypothetical protein
MNFLNNKDSEDKSKSFLSLTKCDAQAPIFGKNGGDGCADESKADIIAREFSISNIWAHAVFFARCGFKVFPQRSHFLSAACCGAPQALQNFASAFKALPQDAHTFPFVAIEYPA